MPRGRRLVFDDIALHLVQRGVNRDRCFFVPTDYADYLRLLAVFSEEYRCSVHAYCLMTNHIHLLLTPHQRGACARLMKQLNQCYVQRLNQRMNRTGTLWEGRFHSSVVTSDEYALACYRYIELNPVRAGMVPDPTDYAWSSYRANAEGTLDPVLRPHDAYRALDGAYRSLFAVELAQTQIDDIRNATRGGYRIGEKRRRRGRPRREENSTSPQAD